MSLFSWFFFHFGLRLYLVRFPNPLDIGSQAGTLSNYTQLLESTIPALSLSSLVPRSLLLLLYLSNRVKWISSKLLITWLWYFLFYFRFFLHFLKFNLFYFWKKFNLIMNGGGAWVTQFERPIQTTSWKSPPIDIHLISIWFSPWWVGLGGVVVPVGLIWWSARPDHLLSLRGPLHTNYHPPS